MSDLGRGNAERIEDPEEFLVRLEADDQFASAAAFLDGDRHAEVLGDPLLEAGKVCWALNSSRGRCVAARAVNKLLELTDRERVLGDSVSELKAAVRIGYGEENSGVTGGERAGNKLGLDGYRKVKQAKAVGYGRAIPTDVRSYGIMG